MKFSAPAIWGAVLSAPRTTRPYRLPLKNNDVPDRAPRFNGNVPKFPAPVDAESRLVTEAGMAPFTLGLIWVAYPACDKSYAHANTPEDGSGYPDALIDADRMHLAREVVSFLL